MTLAEATRLVGRLKNAYPRMTLDEPEMELLIKEVALLSDPLILNAAIDRIIHVSERFPSIAEIRAQYRASNEAARKPPALPETPRGGIPEWVQVWRWQMNRTLTERQAMNTTTNRPVADRSPVKMRDFPQYEYPGPDAYSDAEYQQLRSEWVAAGSPKLGATELLTV